MAAMTGTVECSGAEVTVRSRRRPGTAGGRESGRARWCAVFAWNSAATERRRPSSSGGPTSCIESGSPPEKPIGSATAGRPATLPAGAERVGRSEQRVEVLLHPRRREREVRREHEVEAREEAGERALHLAAHAHGAHVVGGVRLRQVVLGRPRLVRASASSRVRPAADELLEGGRRLRLDEERRERARTGSCRELGRLEERARLAEHAPARPRTPRAHRRRARASPGTRGPRRAARFASSGRTRSSPGGAGMRDGSRAVLAGEGRRATSAQSSARPRERPELVHRVRERHRAVARGTTP